MTTSAAAPELLCPECHCTIAFMDCVWDRSEPKPERYYCATCRVYYYRWSSLTELPEPLFISQEQYERRRGSFPGLPEELLQELAIESLQP